MKGKLLLLGGSKQQVIAIEKAQELGYETVLCDYLEDNPGQYIADHFYLVSTTDKEEVLKIAEKEAIQGIVAYSSDPAAPTAAYVSEKLSLPGISYEVASSFCDKQLFRNFLEEKGFCVPGVASGTCDSLPVKIDSHNLRYPIIVKPTDSSGSKGVTVLDGPGGLSKAIEYAARYSRNGKLVAEEFVQRDHSHVIEAEVFVLNGEVVSWGLINSIRDSLSNPLLPAAYTYPLDLPQSRREIVKDQVSRLIKATECDCGAFNIEMIFDSSDRLFFLDAGPRNGGNRLPEFISAITGADIVSTTIRSAMGEPVDDAICFDSDDAGFWGLVVLHSTRAGELISIDFSDLANEAIVWLDCEYQLGDAVRPFERCDDLLGLCLMHFQSKDDMDKVMNNLSDHVIVRLR